MVFRTIKLTVYQCDLFQIQDLSKQLGVLKTQFEASTAEQQDLKRKADLMEKRLDAASRLIEGLASEHQRWSKEVEELCISREKLLGDCLISSAFLRYAKFAKFTDKTFS